MDLSFSAFSRFPVEWGITTRVFPLFLSGIEDLKDSGKASALQEYFFPSRHVIFPEQVHGEKVRFVSPEDFHKETSFSILPEADGLLTDLPNTTLAVLTADCLPIFFLVPDPLTVGIVHAGWRGSVASIARRAVEQLQRATRQDPSRFLVALGPCIRRCCYEVGEEMKRLFPATWAERDGRLTLDLVRENREQLEKVGVEGENIGDCFLCTSCHPEKFYSYRREKEKAGRMVSWIRVKNMLP